MPARFADVLGVTIKAGDPRQSTVYRKVAEEKTPFLRGAREDRQEAHFGVLAAPARPDTPQQINAKIVA